MQAVNSGSMIPNLCHFLLLISIFICNITHVVFTSQCLKSLVMLCQGDWLISAYSSHDSLHVLFNWLKSGWMMTN